MHIVEPIETATAAAAPGRATEADRAEYAAWRGNVAYDASGQRVLGRVEAVFVDDTTGHATWATVSDGVTPRSFVPMAGARVTSGEPTFAFDRATVNGAPKPSELSTETHLSVQDQVVLHAYYGLDMPAAPSVVYAIIVETAPPAPILEVVPSMPQAAPPTQAEHLDHAHWQGHDAYDSSGQHVLGTLDNVFVDDTTGVPTWASIAYGTGVTDRSFVPMAGVRAINNEPIFAFDMEKIHAAPKATQPSTEAHLSPDDQAALRVHYGLDHLEEPKIVAATFEDGNLTAAQVVVETTEEALQHNTPTP